MIELFKKLALSGDAVVLWLLVAASITSLAVVIDRWRAFRRNAVDFPALMETLASTLDAGEPESATQAALRAGGLEGRVAAAGLARLDRGAAAVEQAMLAKLVLERGQLEKNLIILGTLGNNAPFVGLFGTVLGIIKSFNDLAVTGGSGASVVMSGISSALVATAFGILVAIPAVAANNYFQTKLRRACSNAQSLIHMLQSQLQSQQPSLARTAVLP
jgi:biopolymer transport protein ExbB